MTTITNHLRAWWYGNNHLNKKASFVKVEETELFRLSNNVPLTALPLNRSNGTAQIKNYTDLGSLVKEKLAEAKVKVLDNSPLIAPTTETIEKIWPQLEASVAKFDVLDLQSPTPNKKNLLEECKHAIVLCNF